MQFLEKLKILEKKNLLGKEPRGLLEGFYLSYAEAVKANQRDMSLYDPLLNTYLELILDQIKTPYHFEIYHQRITTPVDYYQFGLDFLRPLVKFDQSAILGQENLEKIDSYINTGDNVILLSNHQTEPDPQAISLLLEHHFPELAQNMIMIAGHRVTTDPLAVPFSKGRNLLCVYSRNYIDHPPEMRPAKLTHNQKTIKKMQELLSEGGKCIYVAPSGGRDRKNAEGTIEVSPFDPQSIELFLLTAKRSKKPTHFYPLALSTYEILPPPERVHVQLGEPRVAQSAPIHLSFGQEINMEEFPGFDRQNKKERRASRADYIWNIVKTLYSQILEPPGSK